MFLVLLNNFDELIKSSKCANRFYDYRYFYLKYHNIYFAISGIPTYKCTKYDQLQYRMVCYLFNACTFKKVLSSFLCSFSSCFKFRVRITHIIISTYMVCMVTVIFFCSMNFSSDMIVCQNINMININTIFQSQYREICTLIYSTVFQYYTLCTVHVPNNKNINVSTVSQYRSAYTVPDFINVIFHVNVNWDLTCTATTIDHALYFNKCFFATPSFGDYNTSTFSCFFNKFFFSLPSYDNNNVNNDDVTRVALKYNNGSTVMAMTHRSLAKPMLGLGGVPKFSSVPTLFPSVSATFWCSFFVGVLVVFILEMTYFRRRILGGVMMVFIPVITYFRWPISGGVSVLFIPASIHFCIHFRLANFQQIKIDLHSFIMRSLPSVYIPFSSHHTKGIGGGSTG